jgi:aminoglycoside phosphotransferase (APT) family kinase protein
VTAIAPSANDLLPFLAKHGLRGEVRPLPGGYVNFVFAVGDDFVVRVNRPDRDTEDAYTESVAVPVARSAGVRAPELLVFDDSREALDAVVTVYARAAGEALGTVRVAQEELPSLYRGLGREIARLHTRVAEVEDPNGWLDHAEYHDPRSVIEEAVSRSRIERLSGDWLARWTDKIRPELDFNVQHVFLHNDLHAGNTMVFRSPLRLSAVIDWGDAAWMDPMLDFETMPVWCVPWALEGYRSEGGTVDETFLGRLLWHNVGTALAWEPDDDRAGKLDPWAPLPSSLWINLVRLMRMDLPQEWRPWLPPSPL